MGFNRHLLEVGFWLRNLYKMANIYPDPATSHKFECLGCGDRVTLEQYEWEDGELDEEDCSCGRCDWECIG